MDDFLTRNEHNEFAKRMDEANERQSKRLSILEDKVQEVNETSLQIKELSVKMSQMIEEQGKQGKRLEEIESRDGEMWRKVVSYIITAIIGIVIGFVFKLIGM